VAGTAQDAAALEVINRASARAPRSPIATWRPDADPVAATDHHGASRADLLIAALAADAIELLTGPRRGDLRACRAPGCVLLFLKDHPRREWCSNTCGNRARQARHYHRTRRQRPS
jgi:predicted RNA-binding Zn ribbon-like protein